jgi:hypothetical protein
MDGTIIKVRNNNNEVIEVSKVAYDVLYSKRDGFSLYSEDEYETTQAETEATEETKEVVEESEKTDAKTTEKAVEETKSVKKRGRPKKKSGGDK